MNEDESHLNILSIFHYVVAAMAGLIACFPIIHLVIGISMLTGSFFPRASDAGEAFPFTLFGLFFTIIPAAIILFGWAFAICLAVAGHFLSKKQRYMFCLVMACVSCIFMPFGTVLGVFTILVLMRPPVKAMFHYGPATVQA